MPLENFDILLAVVVMLLQLLEVVAEESVPDCLGRSDLEMKAFCLASRLLPELTGENPMSKLRPSGQDSWTDIR